MQTVTRYGETGPGPKGSVMTIAFELRWRSFGTSYQTAENKYNVAG